jgi:hypothetical protein
MKPYFLVVALLLGACCFLGDMTRDPAQANDDGLRLPEAGLVQENCLRPLRTKVEFRAALRAERVALFFLGAWSTDSILARGKVDSWIHRCQPPFEVFLVDPDKQPYVRRWLEEQDLDDSFHTIQRKGHVVWLRRGTVLAETSTSYDGREEELSRLTRKVFGEGPP